MIHWRAVYQWIMLIIFLGLCIQGLFNLLFRETPLEAWKQAGISLSFALVILSGDARHGSRAFLLSLGGAAVLFLSSALSGIGLPQASFSLFAYVSWVPFLVWGAAPDTRDFLYRNRALFFAVIAFSALGLAVQLTTNALDMLIEDREDLMFRLSTQQARRIYFLFVSSTIVMPTLAVLFTLYVLAARSTFGKLLGWSCLAVAAVATGSLSGFVVCGFALAVLLSDTQPNWRLAILVGLALAVAALLAGGDETVARQVGRVLGNDLESASNLQRLALWSSALALIGGFDPLQIVMGLGLGVTNLGRFSDLPLIHGESSFFQAMIEGGAIGLALRTAPFAFLLVHQRAGSRERWLCGTGLFIACAVAPIFPAVGLQAGLGLLAGLGLAASKPVSKAPLEPAWAG